MYDLAKAAEANRETIRLQTSVGRDILRSKPNTKVDKLPNGVNFVRTNPTKNIGVWSYDPVVKARMNEAFRRVYAREALRSIYADAGFNSPTALRNSLQSKLWIGYKCKTKTHTAEVWDSDAQKMRPRNRVLLTSIGQEVKEVACPGLIEKSLCLRRTFLRGAGNPCRESQDMDHAKEPDKRISR